ncbi:MAG: DMT family transporter [Paracoccaceae bacterium]
MNAQITIPARAWGEILLLSLLWGGSFLAISFALREVGVFTVVAIRVLGAALVLWAYVLARGLALPRSPRVWGGFLVMGLLNNVIPFSLIVWGQQNIPSGLASILNASTAIFGVIVAAAVFADERLTARKAVGVSLGFVGVATAIGLSALHEFDLRSLAQLAIIGAAISYAFAGAWARIALKGLTPQVAAAGMTSCAALFMVPTALLLEGAPSLSHAPATLAALAYLAVVATALAYLLYYRVLAVAGSGNLMLVTLLVAPVAIALGAIVLGEELPRQAYAGFALLAVGLIVLDGRLLARFRR